MIKNVIVLRVCRWSAQTNSQADISDEVCFFIRRHAIALRGGGENAKGRHVKMRHNTWMPHETATYL